MEKWFHTWTHIMRLHRPRTRFANRKQSLKKKKKYRKEYLCTCWNGDGATLDFKYSGTADFTQLVITGRFERTGKFSPQVILELMKNRFLHEFGHKL